MRTAFPTVVLLATPAFAAEDETMTRGVWGIIVIALAFIILAFIGSRR